MLAVVGPRGGFRKWRAGVELRDIITDSMPDLPRSRRALLRFAAIPLAAPLVSRSEGPAVRPFRVNVSQGLIDRILTRLRQTRWPDRLDSDDWRYGANWNYLRELTGYWTTKFDWRRTEARMNRHEQFLARIDDLDIHFFHVKGRGRRNLPLLLTHGWPGSVLEFLDAIEPLTDPVRFGGSAEDAFDVIIPSLPGFGFSSKPKGKPIGPAATARIWHRLMTETLGYRKYGAQGGDWGAGVTVRLARLFPQDLVGIHLNTLSARRVPEAEQTPEERAWWQKSSAFQEAEFDYFHEQQHKPQTVAFALSDNPLGAAAWIVEKFKAWSDSGANIEQAFTKDQLLSDVMLYLLTDTVGTSVWFYRGALDEAPLEDSRVTVPTGFAAF